MVAEIPKVVILASLCDILSVNLRFFHDRLIA